MRSGKRAKKTAFLGFSAILIAKAVVTAAPAAEPVQPLRGIENFGFELYQARCSNCHSNEAGKTLFAPTLFGLMGRRAGSVEGFPYTQKITQLGFDWSTESLSRWLSVSSLDSPILRMRHLGVEDPAERDALVAYISTLKPN
jgi:cytochrome c